MYITYADIFNQMTEVKMAMDVGFVNCTRHMHQSSANFNNIVRDFVISRTHDKKMQS